MHIRRMLCVLMLVASGCAEYPIKTTAWSDAMPADEVFLAHYQQDTRNANLQSLDDYLLWVKRFYLGWELYPDGWNRLTDRLVWKLEDPMLVQAAKEKLQNLGVVIASEWAKNNQTRRITSQHVSVWGNALLNSLHHGETLSILERVEQDVEDLLANRVSPALITENRFYPEDDIFSELE